MSEKKIILVGDSHIGALHQGRPLVKKMRPTSESNKIQIIFCDSGLVSREFVLDLASGSQVLNPIVVQRFHQDPMILDRWTGKVPLAGTQHEIIMLMGFVEMNATGLHPKWEGFAINDCWLNKSRSEGSHAATKPIRYAAPPGLVYEILEHNLAPLFAGVDFLKAKGANISMLMGPPPVPDNQYIQEKLRRTPLSSAYTRHSIYRMLLRIFHEKAESKGFKFYDFSERFSDSEGFRQREYWGDGIHGSPEYGRDLLFELEKFVIFGGV